MTTTDTSSLSIRRAFYEDVTEVPHFPIEISFAGHQVSFEDIYFDGLAELPAKLQALEATRKGNVVLDGGSRVRISLEPTSTGALVVRFRTEQNEPSFPGRCILEGKLSVEGERVGELMHSLRRLISDGVPLLI